MRLLLAAWLLGAALLGCEGGGTSSETVGFGRVEAVSGPAGISGRTEPGLRVGLYHVGYLPHLDSGFADTVTAGSDGRFAFPALPTGGFNLVVARPSDGKAACLGGLTVPGKDSASGILEATGRLQGRITDSSRVFATYALLPGTPYFARGDSLARFELSGLPAGDYRVVKAWTRLLPCDTAVCGGIESLRDTATVRIRAGEKTDG